MAKKKVTKITSTMRSTTAAPLTATVLGTAVVGVLAWISETWVHTPIPGFVQAYLSSLASVYIWFKMPVEWESK